MRENWEYISEIIQAIIGAGNIFVVWKIFRSENSERKKESSEKEVADNNKRLVASKELWYSEIVIKRSVVAVEEFFDKNNKLISLTKTKLKEHSEYNKAIDEFYDDFYQVKHILLPATKVFNDDLSRSLGRIIQEYCDNFTVNIESSFNKKFIVSNLKNLPDTYKYKILQQLYQYDVKADVCN
ncbi:hypothetical protein R2R35_19750 [Anaerocolumna sp. AGMB13020]|uniref:hypothetical protein n=1 Tax=Anaerocolumna sp. AGMB13020 TaxID=3081750 RepID=UPI002955AAE3|nr:hypothetical protein [Anaerocolumna sp. AGMB13020]WOO36007.1 hypothetical protein R2R35_19750 [Anaerocolumna sp. AGMB13020]